MHLAIGVPEFFTVAAYVIIFGFFWRTLAAKYADTPIGRAMAYIF